jgi:hypothetical protein
MAARLKVFTWSDGFHRYTVATSSRAKALEAWGFRRDLFKTGDAQEVASGDDYSEALAHPGVSVERGLSIDTGKIRLKTPARAKPKPEPKPAAPSARDRERVSRLEAELEALDNDLQNARADLDRRRQALDAAFAKAQADFKTRRRALTAKLDAARRKIA